MEHRKLGKTGLDVSVLGFGGAEIGFEGAPDNDVEILLNAAIDAGLNTIDTAECYADSEEKIGRAISHRRGEFHLFTKVGHASGLEGEDWNIGLMEKSIERSLQRLQTDCVDLIQLHTCSLEQLQRGDVIEVLKRAQAAGKTRFIGYSGDNEAAQFAVESGHFDTLQTSLNVCDQNGGSTFVPLALQNGMGVIAKRPIANAVWRYDDLLEDDHYHRAYQDRWRELNFNWGKRADVAAAVALRWTLQNNVSTAIVGTKNPSRWAQNAALLAGGPLDAELFESIGARWREVGGKNWEGKS
ncbi:putative oxidoreductase [Abditibacterium utsteinense]|uniref:Putative oxidoreductase n=1 Tax=Abditibacterium utsteinense TaxID=1960156 RepID=A0A2S8SWA8_9BACT|nr:aldo/keto reductase [Abditibacterium utsteinense]PQV65091.1 putative oxidoreductase [Abditibacterium utsteinense]